MLCLLLMSCSVLAQADATDQADPQIRALVRQLDDDDWGRRERAEQQLTEMGPRVLPYLPPDDSRLSPEAKQRLARIRTQLQVEVANQAVEASRVTLQGPTNIGAALAAIEQQTGNALRGYDEFADREIRVDLQAVPFWEALDQVLDQAQLTLYPYDGDDRALRVVARDEGQAERCGKAYYEGVFRVQPTYVSGSRDLINPVIQGLRVRLALSWEPRTKPIAISLPLDGITANDDLGNPIAVDGAGGRLSAAVESDISLVELQLPLTLPSRQAKSIRRLHGAFEVLIPGQIETFEFAGLNQARGTDQRRAGVTVRLEEVRQNEDVYELHLRVVFDDASNALESHRGWIYKNDAYLLGADGRRYEYGGKRLLGQDENSIFINYLFAVGEPLEKCKFVYKSPALIIRQPMQFVLQDIDLP